MPVARKLWLPIFVLMPATAARRLISAYASACVMALAESWSVLFYIWVISLFASNMAFRQEGKLMYIVSMLSQKGGTGKTTLSLHLAVAAERAGQRAVVIDLDPQASSAEWKDSRAGETPVVVPIPSSRLPHAVQAARDGNAALVVIDTAPHASDDALA